MPFGHVLADEPALPLAEVHLTEVGCDDRRQTQPLGERCCGLGRALQRRHVDGADVLVLQPVGDLDRLLLALDVQRRIALPVDGGEVDALDGGGRLAVTHEEQLARTGRTGESVLAVLGGHRRRTLGVHAP